MSFKDFIDNFSILTVLFKNRFCIDWVNFENYLSLFLLSLPLSFSFSPSTFRCLPSPFLITSFSLFLSLPACLPGCLSVSAYLYLTLPLLLPACLSVCLSLFLSPVPTQSALRQTWGSRKLTAGSSSTMDRWVSTEFSTLTHCGRHSLTI